MKKVSIGDYEYTVCTLKPGNILSSEDGVLPNCFISNGVHRDIFGKDMSFKRKPEVMSLTRSYFYAAFVYMTRGHGFHKGYLDIKVFRDYVSEALKRDVFHDAEEKLIKFSVSNMLRALVTSGMATRTGDKLNFSKSVIALDNMDFLEVVYNESLRVRAPGQSRKTKVIEVNTDTVQQTEMSIIPGSDETINIINDYIAGAQFYVATKYNVSAIPAKNRTVEITDRGIVFKSVDGSVRNSDHVLVTGSKKEAFERML
jgi:hypothetical protein